MPAFDRAVTRLLEHMRDAVVVIDPADGQVVLWNAAASRLFGHAAQEMLGTSVARVIPELLMPSQPASIARSLAAEGDDHAADVRVHELPAIRKDGYELRVELTLSPLHDGDERVHALAIVRDVTVRQVLEQRAVLAFRDPLTGLPNRALFMDRLAQALLRDEREHPRQTRRVAVLFLDLDRFKIVNDSLGHQVGDRLLVAAARRIEGALRAEDTASRFGGDEFTVLLEAVASEQGAIAVAERVIGELSAPFALGDREIFVSASVGVSLSGNGRDDPEELLREADIAMYRAKRMGPGRHALFEPTMNADALARLALEGELRRVVERQELEVAFRPVMRLADGAWRGAEALARPRGALPGLLGPDDFATLAEDLGLMSRVGRWTLWQACRAARGWPSAAADVPMVAVKLSARHLQAPALVDDVARVLDGVGLAPARLMLEIPERVLRDDLQVVAEITARLKQLGVTLAVEGFGGEASSLATLRNVLVDAIKLAPQLVAGLGRDRRDEAIVAALIDLAHGLDLRVIADGVDDDLQLARLIALGCDDAQGAAIEWLSPIDEAFAAVAGGLVG